MFQGDEPIYRIIIPGREIPKWFRHQSVGTSMNLQVPSDKLKGVAVCALFVLRQHHPAPPLNLPYSTSSIFTHSLQCYLKADGYERKLTPLDFFFSEEFGKIDSHHLYLGYYPYNMNQNQVDGNGLGQIEIAFETDGPGLEVTKCGARLVFEQDIEDLNQTMSGCSSNNRCSITPYEDDLEDSAKDTKTKRSHDDYDGTSGEGTSNEVDVPHPKRIQLSNLIERFIPHLGNWIGNLSTQGQGHSDCEEEESQ